MHPAKKRLKLSTKQKFSSYTKKNENLPKLGIGEIKVDTSDYQPHVIPEVDKITKVTREWQEQLHTSIIPDQALRESTM